MPYDASEDPPFPVCPSCGLPILQAHKITLMISPDGMSSQQWHSTCARVHWDKISPMLRRIGFLG